ncbi:hypothetical protein A2526_04185 [candidate division WOR-1 bacterium RIFOXYD2_FULL_36_8]|uniref:Uncharacterized protein n=1 Tax=candidate division WOR-1 bacterium RIFOXYB2_FULL_36_35 TaxID=1802578 RepID=A0A1F4S152_UNCSA|nr:MAG: hypothetical protein A2230_03490 [candidate division WOR-1 bacterium RIFOXYA2_FULL_36_21]OGC14161.1 MAG: hypothetical protein A2290_00600 [candidate division WOR-1 bacterium RIFOXYB2_FULL_36_35]OGC15383.1 MAG: hypothetical protein A2282_01590 [candidate division WOR-1 bacterium RIFOXYA12_FULL_36_13]OGC40077.1 MAG: hypothetical protein A2526_04185 [candidate division WOR-1 bacterium RIFOXYD2_FULL_36_8]
MSRLLDAMKSKTLTLIVHIPENVVDLAKAAESSGADVLIVSYDKEADKIPKEVSIPVGLDLSLSAPKDIESLSGFDFINFNHNALDNYANFKNTKVIILDDYYTLDKLMSITAKNIDAINAAIIPIRQKGKDLLVGDLQNYIAIALSSNLPVIIPTQRSIKVSEVSIIWDTGVKGLILTDVVLGKNIKLLSKAIKEYRVAIDDIVVTEEE